MKRKNQEDRKEDNEWEPAPILAATYHDTDNKYVLAAVDGKFLGSEFYNFIHFYFLKDFYI